MKKSDLRYFMSIVFVINFLNCISQQPSDSLVLKKRTICDMNGRWYSDSTVLNMMRNFPEAYSYMEKAVLNYKTGQTFVYGGTLFLIPVFVSRNNSQKLLFAGIALTVDIIGLIIASGYKKNAEKAVKAYNKGIHLKKLDNTYSFNLRTSMDGIGVIIRF